MNPSNSKSPDSTTRDDLCVNTIRFLSVDAIEQANSGHPGLPLGAAAMSYVLWTRFLRHNPANPHWFNRDRFVLSAGHGSALLYSLLHLTGYDLSIDEIRDFRQWGSRTAGHPERGLAPGVETTTGPLGQGFANGVGMAIAEAHLAARYNRPGLDLIDHYTYALVSDGDLMEGVAAEAASLAGHLKLGKLIYLYDDNGITLAASTQLSFTEDRAQRLAACGWHVATVEDGNDLEAVDAALRAAREETKRPSLILVRTHIGYGSPRKQDTPGAHGSPLGKDETAATKKNLGWPVEPPFLVPPQAAEHFRNALADGASAESEWAEKLAAYRKQFPDLALELETLMSGGLPTNWDAALPVFPTDAKGMATRAASGAVLQVLQAGLPSLFGGSADLSPSTNTDLKGQGNFQSPDTAVGDRQGAMEGSWDYSGRNLEFGVREHAMGSILNGMAAHGGVLPFGGTFLTFSDYMRPTIRLAALMELQVAYVFTHDSIGMGEDGPTHQSVEHVASLRAIPGLTVIRPADANETTEAWRVAVESRTAPVALILSRQNLPTLDRTRYAPAANLRQGGYVLADAAGGNPQLILIASGSEVELVLAASELLEKDGVAVRVVSMPSWELFDGQSEEYRQSVLPLSVAARVAVEAGVSMGWHRYVGDRGAVIGVDRFGASGPGPRVMREFGFSPENVRERALEVLGRKA